MNVFGTVTTVSPGFNADRDQREPQRIGAASHADTVSRPQKAANSLSNSSTFGPPMNPALLSALRNTATSSSSSSR